MRRPAARMPLAAILGEAFRDVRTGTTRALLFSVLLGVLLAAGATLAASDQLRALDAAATYRASGAATTVLRADGRIDGQACDAFVRLPGVQAAGALRAAADDLVPSALPGSPISTKEVSPAFVQVVRAAGSMTGGILLSDEAVDELSPRHDAVLSTRTGSARIAGTFAFPDDGRQGDLGFSALVPQPGGDPKPYDECWVDVWPENAEVTSLLRTAILPGLGGDDADRPTTQQLNGRLGSQFAAADGLSGGLSRFAPGGAAAAGLGLGIVSIRLRRLELASARHAGVSRAAQSAGQLLQALVWVGAGVALASPAALASLQGTDSSSGEALLMTASTPIAAGAFAAIAGASGAALLTREGHLFRYFKER